MSKDEKETCLYCKAWNLVNDTSENKSLWRGQCRLRGPETASDDKPFFQAVWPRTSGADWCLEFKEHPDNSNNAERDRT